MWCRMKVAPVIEYGEPLRVFCDSDLCRVEICDGVWSVSGYLMGMVCVGICDGCVGSMSE